MLMPDHTIIIATALLMCLGGGNQIREPHTVKFQRIGHISAGVMIYVSMIDIFPKAQIALISSMGEQKGK